jgi:hypothetical protein
MRRARARIVLLAAAGVVVATAREQAMVRAGALAASLAILEERAYVDGETVNSVREAH